MRWIVSRSLWAVLLVGCAAHAPDPRGWRELVPASRDSRAFFVPTPFPGAGDVATTPEGTLVLGRGEPLTGVTWPDSRSVPKSNYEVALEVVRLEGQDFFCALTFPVADAHCTLILGGWGGQLCGLSCVDGQDASRNATTTTREFHDRRLVSVRLEVTTTRIRTWVDDEVLVDQKVPGHEFSVRWEMEPCRPFGVATYETTAELRRLRWRPLPRRAP